jgi:hypothetical protein
MQFAPNQLLASNSHQINLLPEPHPHQSLFFAHNPYALNILSATSTQSIFWPTASHATN